MTTVPLYETQLAFLDRIAGERGAGESRAEVLRGALLEHVGQRLAGAGPYVGGASRYETLETAAPSLGEPRRCHRIEPIAGKAVTVRCGEVLRIEQLGGETCVDFNAFNLHDYKESLDCGFTRSSQSFTPGRGEFIWTNAPRGRPMFAILSMPESCEIDITGHRCNRVYQDLGWGLIDHPNCQDSLAEAIREYGLTPDDVHDSFNMWMATTVDEEGRRQFRWNPGRPGDRVELLALFDVLAATVICGSGELVGINNYKYEPIQIEVLEASEDTTALTDAVNDRWGSRPSQVGTEDLADIPIRAERELRRNEDYAPSFRPAPAIVEVALELDEGERGLVAELIASGTYGSDEGEAIRAAFMRWCNSNWILFRRPLISFGEPAAAAGQEPVG
jgi:uncharacterized protein YcgI (DUF1989 family)